MTSLPSEQPPQPAPSPPQAPLPAQLSAMNGFATAAVAVSFFGCIGMVLGTIFGIVALRQIRRTGERGSERAKLALVIGGIWVVVFGALSVHSILTPEDRPSPAAAPSQVEPAPAVVLSVGQCVEVFKGVPKRSGLTTISCTQLHEAEVVGEICTPGKH